MSAWAFGFAIGSLFGSAVTWKLAVAKERHRRIRRDIKASIAGLKTLARMLRRETGNLLKAGAVVALVVAVAVVLVTR